MRNWFKVPMGRQVVSMGLAALLVACGGGSEGGSGESQAQPVRATSSQLQPDASLIPSADVGQLVVADVGASDGVTRLTVPGTAASVASGSDAWALGKVVTLPGGMGTPFPLGQSGRVTSRSQRSDGGLDLTLSPVRLADVVQSYIQEARTVSLDASNFVGVITPSSLSGLQAVRHGKNLAIANVPLKARNQVQRQASTAVPGDLGTIDLTASIDLKELQGTEGQQGPVSAESKVTVTSKLSNLKLVQQMDFDKRSGIPVSLKSMDFRVTGDLSAEAKLEGSFDVTLGSYSNAWKSVEERSLAVLGIHAKLSGLQAKDKIGKYPLVGLVFSVPCATTVACINGLGSTETPVIEAQTGGVIVWLYLTAQGQIKVEGSVGVKINNGTLEIGMVKPESGELDSVAKLIGKATGNLLEAPRFTGDATLQAKAGFEVEADLFVAGVWIGNMGVFGGMQYNGKAKIEEALTYGAPQLAGPWQWTGSACVSSTFGIGLQAHGAVALGASLDTAWKDVSASLKYEFSMPQAADLTKVGTYALGGVDIWKVYAGMSKCWPEPEVTSVSPAEVTIGDSNRFVITGTNFPQSITAKFDDGASSCSPPEQVTKTSFTVICTAGGTPGPRKLAVSATDVPITSDSVVTFKAPQTRAPAIFMTLSAESISQGSTATLEWSALDASACIGSGAWTGPMAVSGRLAVSPPSPGSYRYALKCDGPGGSSTAKVDLVVGGAVGAEPPLVTMSVWPTQVVQGSSSVIRWWSSGATSCSAEGSWSGSKGTSGEQTVSPLAGNYSYTLSCSGPGGNSSATASLVSTAADSGVTLFADDFSAPTLDLNKWRIDPCQADYNGRPATYAIESGALKVDVPGGSDGYMGKCSGNKFVAKTGAIAGDFEVTVSLAELLRQPVSGQKDNSGFMLTYGRTSVAVAGNYSGYWWGTAYSSYNRHRIWASGPDSVSAPCLLDESLSLSTLHAMDFRIRRAQGIGYVAYRLQGTTNWIERTCTLDASGEVFVHAWSGDGGYTSSTGRFVGTIDNVLIRRP